MKLRTVFTTLFLAVALAVAFLSMVASGYLGRPAATGMHALEPVPAVEVALRKQRQEAVPPGPSDTRILFGDFHAHSTLSGDAAIMGMALLGGEGSRSHGAACDFARYCSALDFWSINDHAEQLTPRLWRETIEAVRSCNAINPDPYNPDTVAFLGWEWSQMGDTPQNHYGHRNVIFAGTGDDEVPARAIASRAPRGVEFGQLPKIVRVINFLFQPNRYALDLGNYFEEVSDAMNNICADGVPVRDLPADCFEEAATPAELFAKLDDWGFDSLVIPHGTTWGNYTPPLSSWEKQLAQVGHDPARQTLVEVYSGHGAGEVYRPWRAADVDANGIPVCPEPTSGYLPSCWRAGEIIRDRCLNTGEREEECESRAVLTRRLYIERGIAGHHVVPGTRVEDWLDAGQCADCFLPSFNYRPMGSLQYMLALSGFDEGKPPRRFRFGVVGSSDNHAARPGTGYKELNRREMTEALGFRKGLFNNPGSEPGPAVPDPVDISSFDITDRAERDRINSFFSTGGLVAVHAAGRARGDIWDAVKRKQVYGTSGDRILLWFDAGSGGELYPMGSELRAAVSPRFTVKAVGAFEQRPGCPDSSRLGLGAERLSALCRDECYNPSETRKIIERLEVVKIIPQVVPGEPVERLIQDPYLVHECTPDQLGCSFSFSDPEYTAWARDTVYYVRAIQAPSDAINGDNLRCEYDEDGTCIAVNPCHGNEALTEYEDDCLAPVNERAWSSPIFVDYHQRQQPGN